MENESLISETSYPPPFSDYLSKYKLKLRMKKETVSKTFSAISGQNVCSPLNDRSMENHCE
jgi:hypothetical protein